MGAPGGAVAGGEEGDGHVGGGGRGEGAGGGGLGEVVGLVLGAEVGEGGEWGRLVQGAGEEGEG